MQHDASARRRVKRGAHAARCRRHGTRCSAPRTRRSAPDATAVAWRERRAAAARAMDGATPRRVRYDAQPPSRRRRREAHTQSAATRSERSAATGTAPAKRASRATLSKPPRAYAYMQRRGMLCHDTEARCIEMRLMLRRCQRLAMSPTCSCRHVAMVETRGVFSATLQRGLMRAVRLRRRAQVCPPPPICHTRVLMRSTRRPILCAKPNRLSV